jgi:hypothetical protein
MRPRPTCETRIGIHIENVPGVNSEPSVVLKLWTVPNLGKYTPNLPPPDLPTCWSYDLGLAPHVVKLELSARNPIGRGERATRDKRQNTSNAVLGELGHQVTASPSRFSLSRFYPQTMAIPIRRNSLPHHSRTMAVMPDGDTYIGHQKN